ncbi:cupin domain-containing protein [Hymenobacter sp. BT18]|uniref:cupin domain-containing protein n=1 Tax=Hymenobacter sp. BT18 TaxID=2835648 RepID=UPI00143E5E5D|nr:cupin domain-containing protein [Hymenobacter sp. BT18]QIX62800.1 cupin domain-containing protein [Hymenobacter sp. BT18]
MNTASFNEDLAFDENRVKTKVLLETSFSKEIRILLKAGQIMKEHKTPYPILIHVLEGRIALGVHGTTQTMESGTIIFLEGNVPHDLTAEENSVVRLTLSKQDKVERLQEVINS